MTETAIIVCPREGLSEAGLVAAVEVGGLSLLGRALLTARHAGCVRCIVVADAEQQSRLQAGVLREGRGGEAPEWREALTGAEVAGDRCVVLLPSAILTAGALRVWLAGMDAAAAVVAPDRSGRGPVVVPAAEAGACAAAARDGSEGLAAYLARAETAGRLRCLPWAGPAPQPLRTAADVPAAERGMLRALRTAEDGPIVDRYVNRALSAPLTRLLVRTPITPNQLTLASLLVGLLAAWVLAQDGGWSALVGLALFQASVVLDHSDGEVARLRFQFSRLGKWLDNWSDHAVDLAVIASLAWRVSPGLDAGQGLWLGLAAAFGVTGSFLVVFGWTVRGSGTTGGESSRGPADRLIALANRDSFCLTLWGALLIGRPLWFLWALAVGANAFWFIWLMVCGMPRRAGTRG
jgi:phosphatidylglycerophosphate synthase